MQIIVESGCELRTPKTNVLALLARFVEAVIEPENVDTTVRRTIAILVVVLWYISNTSVLLLNKWFLSSTPFRQPILLTLCHMLACSFLGYTFSCIKITPIQPWKSRSQVTRVCSLSVLFCLTIVLGNLSLKYIPISFNQMLGASTPLFTAVFAAVLHGAQEAPLTYLALVPVTGGIILASHVEPTIHIFGSAICLAATAGRALKTVLQAMILQGTCDKLDSMSLLFYMSGFAAILLLPATIVLEHGAIKRTIAMICADPWLLLWLLANSCLAYAVNLTNFLVTKHTSALTLQVLGSCKGILASVVSVLVYKNIVLPIGWLGYAITIAGVIGYSESKRRFKA